jgi:hypothetical protein
MPEKKALERASRQARKRPARPQKPESAGTGFYTGALPDALVAELDVHRVDGLGDEIAMLRVFIRRVIKLAADTDSLEKNIAVLRILGIASARLAGLLKAQKLLTGETDVLGAALSAALAEVTKDWSGAIANLGGPTTSPDRSRHTAKAGNSRRPGAAATSGIRGQR